MGDACVEYRALASGAPDLGDAWRRRGIVAISCLLSLGLVCSLQPQVPGLTPLPALPTDFPRPQHTDTLHLARWLVHQADWGVVSTISRVLHGVPFGNVVSYADGPVGQSTGRLLFYLTTMDATAYDAEANSSAMLTVAEAQLPGSCHGLDAEEPPCAKISIAGQLLRVPPGGEKEARDLLFPRHPAMQRWPVGHAFHLYELHIQSIQMLAWYGGPSHIVPADYFNIQL